MPTSSSSQSKNIQGFSLVQIMIATVIMGVLAMAFSQMMNNSSKAQKTIAQSFEFQNIAALINMSLKDPAKCPLALQDAAGNQVVPTSPNATTFDVADIPIARIKVGSSVIADTTASVGGVAISGMSLTQVLPGNPNTLAPYTMKLRILASKGGGSYGGATITTDLPISVTISSMLSPVIASCSTYGGGGAAANDQKTFVAVGTSDIALPGASPWTDLDDLVVPLQHSSTGGVQYLVRLTGSFFKGGMLQFRITLDGVSVETTPQIDFASGYNLAAVSAQDYIIGAPLVMETVITISDNNPHIVKAQWATPTNLFGGPSPSKQLGSLHSRVLSVTRITP